MRKAIATIISVNDLYDQHCNITINSIIIVDRNGAHTFTNKLWDNKPRYSYTEVIDVALNIANNNGYTIDSYSDFGVTWYNIDIINKFGKVERYPYVK